MEPEFMADDRVELSPGLELRNNDVVLAKIKATGETLLRRFYRRGPEGKTIRLENRNPLYAPKEHDISEFEFIYPVVSLTRLPRRFRQIKQLGVRTPVGMPGKLAGLKTGLQNDVKC